MEIPLVVELQCGLASKPTVKRIAGAADFFRAGVFRAHAVIGSRAREAAAAIRGRPNKIA